MNGTELLPCPFCGGPASYTGAAVRCNSFACNTTMTPRWTKDVVGTAKGDPDVRFTLAKADSARRWNQRGEAPPRIAEAAKVLLAARTERLGIPGDPGEEAMYLFRLSESALRALSGGQADV
ncbi:hypothetical protein [Paracoccus sp. J55]|uniref:hypothetical protein n=1 Tax=Paracoccus sp. J55 TaxID=935849 RepID=UPI00048CC034|nr:hypothetical protein [Paracoccus sp. J55]